MLKKSYNFCSGIDSSTKHISSSEFKVIFSSKTISGMNVVLGKFCFYFCLLFITVGWECGVINKYSLSAGKHKPDDKQCIQSTTLRIEKSVQNCWLQYFKLSQDHRIMCGNRKSFLATLFWSIHRNLASQSVAGDFTI